MDRSPTPAELRELLVAMLAGATAKPAGHWRDAIGPVEHLQPLHLNIVCNWRIAPKGSKRDLIAIAKAADLVRAEFQYVAA